MDKLMIAFRGINNVFEDRAMKEWSQERGYELLTFPFFDIELAIEHVRRTTIRHIEILGYSRGAPSAWELARKTPLQFYQRLITVGTHKVITESFGKTRLPLRNVKEHKNFAETFQQPEGFKDNPINISLGDCSHFDAVKTALQYL